MTRRTHWKWLLFALIAPMPRAWAVSGPPLPLPDPPPISSAEGTGLVVLARTSMHEYLLRRTSADNQAVGARLKRLVRMPYTAAVTLRLRGTPVGRAFHTGPSLPKNVIASALRAMRSAQLPDRVTREYLDTLTVDLEILGGPKPMAARDLDRAIAPGITGLMLTRGYRSVYALASSAAVLGLDARDMRRHCLRQLGMRRDTASLPLQWATFASRHYVGYPNGRVLLLYRGKDLVPREAIDEPMLRAAADRVAAYLIATQHKDGRYGAADGADTESGPASQPGQLRAHTYATWAMARLAAVDDPRGEKRSSKLRGSLNLALGHIASRVRRDARGGAYVATARPVDQLAVTAMLALTLDQMPPSQHGRQLRGQLLAALRAAVGPKSRFSARLDGSDPAKAKLADEAIALLALSTAAQKLTGLRQALAQRARRTPADDVETVLWCARARLVTADAFRSPTTSRRSAGDKQRTPLRDEIGGIGPPDGGPTTMATALKAVVLAQSGQGPTAPTPRLRRDLLEARRFCHQMMYKRREAYFTADPDSLRGAVRARPTAALVTVEACAAAIEAFLAR